MIDKSAGKILLVGSNGQIGHALHECLKHKGFDVATLNRQDVDLLRPGDEKIHVSSDCTILFLSTISRLRQEDEDSYNKNMNMIRNFIAMLDGQSYSKLVFFSSIDIFGRPPQVEFIFPDTAPRPSGFYGLAKMHSEQFLQDTIPASKLINIRLPGIYTLAANDTSVIGQFHNKIKNDEEIIIYDDGSELRSYIHVSELSNFIEKIVHKPFCGNLNITTRRHRSILEYAKIIYYHFSMEPRISFRKAAVKPFDIVVKPVYGEHNYFNECMLDFEDILPLYSPVDKNHAL